MERDTIEVDVVYIGGGPASLSSALHLKQIAQKHNQQVEETGKGEKIESPQIIILEKGANLGAHTLSGAVLDTRIMSELFPNLADLTPPYEAKVFSDSMYFFTKHMKFKIPYTPPIMHNKNFQLISLGKFVKWLGKLAEEQEIEIVTETAGVELLEEDGKIVGVRTGDKGIDKDGQQRSNYEPGIDIRAKVTVLAEGTHGHLTKKLIREKHLQDGKNPMCYATGTKEIWQLPEGRFPAGKMFHSMGWPLPYYQFGGAFVYGLTDNRVAIGIVVGLDGKDPYTDCHRLLQTYKQHPYIKSILKDGTLEKYGAKTIPEGGYWSVPKMHGDGYLMIGDCISLVNVMRLKGIHLAMKSGMVAADTILHALQKNDYSAQTLSQYEKTVRTGAIKKEMWKVRNFRQSYHRTLFEGIFHTGLQFFTFGRGLWARTRSQEDYTTMAKKDTYQKKAPAISYEGDQKLTFDKLTSVYYSGTKHEENQPCHIHIKDPDICVERCPQEYGTPCQYFCPAQVYERVDGKLQINFSNCLHCKTCDIMDPYQNIEWRAPEGNGGPNFNIL
ncbi:MAG TPA: electron transfer flavoprotein-ubiquinone oxidoreductase [Planctomycetota bacterium]|jgi:electron-transferring-flavoprotein dehydrogenase|nr:electron transfer flavoprotein-ubiquinone oxidoreductase [Planctomycetota bacterium]HQB00470.1 electron transfer flavoprotein-ubiquinone oxidoreductase [Planctomycetota bacterium]